MENLALIGLSRQISLHRELEVVANNIANLDTTGYKSDGSVFHEFLMPVARHGAFQGTDQRLSFVHDRATWHNFSSRRDEADRQPARRLDRRRRLPGGADAARRALHAQRRAADQRHRPARDRERRPVLGDGGPIQFQPTDSNVSINPDGTITVREAGNAASDSARGKLRLVRFDAVETLLKDGATTFRAPDGTAPQPAETSVRVVQGTIEASNVRPVVEMARMMELTRTYTTISNLLQQAGEHRRGALDKLAEVPA